MLRPMLGPEHKFNSYEISKISDVIECYKEIQCEHSYLFNIISLLINIDLMHSRQNRWGLGGSRSVLVLDRATSVHDHHLVMMTITIYWEFVIGVNLEKNEYLLDFSINS